MRSARVLAMLFLMVCLLAMGCGDSNGLTAVTGDQLDTAESQNEILAAPKKGGGGGGGGTEDPSTTTYYKSASISSKGGQLEVPEGTQLIVPEGALDKRTTISMEVITDNMSRTDFTFSPHGLVFNVPVEVRLSWATMKNVTEPDLVLYHYIEDTDQWEVETTGVWDPNGTKVTLYLNHFSKYYFERR